MSIERLATGADLRVTGDRGGVVVLALNGGTAKPRPGTWSASVEYVVREAAPRRRDLGWAEVRYRTRSWKVLDECVEDARAALEVVAAAGARQIVVLGYSMGGAVASQVADHGLVRHVIGLAPWLPERLDMRPMRGRRFDVFHGALDRWLPGIPGVSPESSRQGFDRLRALGVTGTYSLIPGAIHALALRAPWGGLVPMPRAGAWVANVLGALPRE